MTFTEIFENFKNHSYIRRTSWDKDMFIQLRSTVSQIRLVKFERGKFPITYDEYVTLDALDLLADDWDDIDNY